MRVQHGSGAEEQHGLERGVADDQQQRGGEGDVGDRGCLPGAAQQQPTATAVTISPTFSVVE